MIITTSQEIDLAIAPVDKRGNPAQIDGVPVWLSSDPDIVTINPAPDGLSAIARAVGPTGNAEIVVTADADLGTGTKAIQGTIEIDVAAGQATSLSIVEGEIREQV